MKSFLYRTLNHEKFRENWNAFITLLSICAGIEIPFRMVLDIPTKGWIYVFDLLLTVCFLLDLIFHLVPKLPVDEDLIHPETSVREYLRSWFVVDLLAAMPFTILLTGFPIDTQGFKAIRLIRLTRLLKLAKLVPLIRKLTFLKSLNPSILRIILFFVILIFVIHWMACGWIALSEIVSGSDPLTTYLRAIYWVVTTMTTVGYGDITPQSNFQVLYAILIMMIGVATYGYVVANLSSYFGNIDTARSEFSRKMAILNAFLVYRDIPLELEKRIRSYYNYIWENRMDHDEDEVIRELPDSLKLDVKLFLRQPLISKVPMFQKASPNLKDDLVNHLNIHVYMPGDIIVYKGDMGDSMFFVSKGSVEILDEEGISFGMLGEGSFFGETSLLKEQPRNATVRSVSFCNVYSLNKDSFDHLLNKHPKFKMELEKTSRDRESKRKNIN
jgi:hypothetical protein